MKTHTFSLPDFDINQLDLAFFFKHSAISSNHFYRIKDVVNLIEVNYALLTYSGSNSRNYVEVKIDENNTFYTSCRCDDTKYPLCEHQAIVLFRITENPDLRIFFDQKLRLSEYLKTAQQFGLSETDNLEQLFTLRFDQLEGIQVQPIDKSLIPFNSKQKQLFSTEFLPQQKMLPIDEETVKTTEFIVFSYDKYAEGIVVKYAEAQLSKDEKLKNPIREINVEDRIFEENEIQPIQFYAALQKLIGSVYGRSFDTILKSLKVIIKNPLNLKFYIHQQQLSSNLTSSSIEEIFIAPDFPTVGLKVEIDGNFYTIKPHVTYQGKRFPISQIKLILGHFIAENGILFLIPQREQVNLLKYFQTNGGKITLHQSKFHDFQHEFLASLEHSIRIDYTYLKRANKQQIKTQKLNSKREKIIYISESDNYILITPTLKYGQIEVPVLSKKQVVLNDQKGEHFVFDRVEWEEENFLKIVQNQHPKFERQEHNEFFYLSKIQFFNDGWFLDAFEEWRENNFTILGFQSIKNNKINQHKAKIQVNVSSGLDWFDASVKIKFGEQTASLKELQKAVKNKTRFVKLGDGTEGILPSEWLKRFSKILRTSEIKEEQIRTAKVNFASLMEIYPPESIAPDIKKEIKGIEHKFKQFKKIKPSTIPSSLNATLRSYQYEGINWLNFLDEFNFGGCLADDMGLGKTIQILAFLLQQRERFQRDQLLSKQLNNTTLIIVPTSLLFNWENEIKKFAPSLKYSTIYGNNRSKNTIDFEKFEVILTTYGTVLSDCYYLKDYFFNYIILDESQAIKNPDSQRNKSVRLLQSRNKLVLTGTPIENNTFDLYAQLSFACPGLLGSKQAFRDDYSTPIDKFKDFAKAKELQHKINPFILRRTKDQVAQELPEKTEMVLYCEMEAEQQAVYDAYKQEIRAYLQASTNDRKAIDNVHVLAALTKLRQICNSPALLNDEEYYGNQSAKINVLMEEIEERHIGHKILVFSQFTSMLSLIESALNERGYQYSLLTGQSIQREKIVNQFKEDEETRIFLISLKAGGVGLNLTEADYVYLVDPWWNPAVENQAIDRCYRIGQDKHVMAIRLITPNTIEEKIMKLQDTKKELAADIIQTDTSILKSLKAEDLLQLLD